eukprot:2719485-Pleurochrysis_carterae.AAC.1
MLAQTAAVETMFNATRLFFCSLRASGVDDSAPWSFLDSTLSAKEWELRPPDESVAEEQVLVV